MMLHDAKLFLKYFAGLLVLDISGVMNLYDQNYVRRIINMYRRRDPLSYRKKLKPFCRRVQQMLSDDEVLRLQSIRIPARKDVPWFSRKNTTSHQCCENFSEEERNAISEISEKVKQVYEEQVGKQLYFMKENKATIYVYHGSTSQHLWHVDPQNIDTIYNVIICIKKKGNISPLQCKDADGNVSSINFEPGYAAIFNGGTTVHQVPPNDDPDSERTVLSIAFTSDPVLAKRDNASRNLCTYIEGGNNIPNMLKLWTATFGINYVLNRFAGSGETSLKNVLGMLAGSMLMARVVPHTVDLRVLGTNRASSLHHNMALFAIFTLNTASLRGGAMFFTYFLLSDVWFPRSMVEYD